MNYNHLASYYKGKRVFITGHTGFKGSWLLYWLHMLEAKIKGYALAPENDTDLFYSIKGSSLCESIIDDILNKPKLEKELIDFEPDFVFHLAAQPLVRLSYDIPTETFAVNAIGTANILDAVRRLKKKCIVVCITTDKVYENKEWQYPYRENDRLGGYDPYSASKACAELVINSYRSSFFNVKDYDIHQKSVAAARAGNVIGGGDWAKDRIIPDIVRALHQNQPVAVRNPNAVRPWQYVLEPIAGYLHLATLMVDNPIEFADSWNFGPLADDNLKVQDLVNIAISVWGRGGFVFPDLGVQPHEAGLLKLDISKAINILKWVPKYNAKLAIEKTLNWYRSYLENNDSTDELMQKSIQEYAE